MNKTKIAINMALAITIGITILFILQNKPTPPQEPVAIKLLPEHLPDFTMQDSTGATRNSREWNGKILIVNFWASWCPPCLEEMPILIELQKQYSSQGVQIIGIAIDDPDQAKSFMHAHSINFPVIIGVDNAIELGKKMGNRISTLPYTAIFDQTGKTIYAQPGKITRDRLEQTLKSLL